MTPTKATHDDADHSDADRAHAPRLSSSVSVRRERRLLGALILNVVIVVLQIVFGIVAHSLGLLSDAGHNITDVAALGLSFLAVRVARRRPTSKRSFGWHRGTVLAAQANAASTLVLTVWISYEAIVRLTDPPKVEGGIVVIIALIAFAANAGAAVAVREGHGASTGPCRPQDKHRPLF